MLTQFIDSLTTENIAQATGVIGAGVYITAYFLLQLGFVRGQSFLYPSLILCASSSVMFSLATDFNLAAVIIQASFFTISLFGLGRMFLLRRRVHFSPDEQQFLDNYLTELRPHQARRLLNTASVETVERGEYLIREGETVENLIYILTGSVGIWISGHKVSDCGPGQMLGELTLGTDLPATATVLADESSRCLVFNGAQLTALTRKNSEVNSALLASHFCSSRDKLVASNSRFVERIETPEPTQPRIHVSRQAQPAYQQR